MRFTASENKSVVSTLLFLPTKLSYPKGGNLVQFCTDGVQFQHNLITLFLTIVSSKLLELLLYIALRLF
jgi:hypothetical protein